MLLIIFSISFLDYLFLYYGFLLFLYYVFIIFILVIFVIFMLCFYCFYTEANSSLVGDPDDSGVSTVSAFFARVNCFWS